MQMRLPYNCALVTGGSSGLGKALSLHLASLGLDILIVSLEAEDVVETVNTIQHKYPGVQVNGLAIDCSKPESVDNIISWVGHQNLNVDLLINNAGFGSYGFLLETDSNKELKMIRLHMEFTYRMIRAFLPEMQDKDHGCVVNLSSISAFQPTPKLATYGATKGFLYNFTIAINEELRMQKSNVHMTVVCPTPINTGFQKRAAMENSKLYDSWMTIPKDKVVKAIIKGIYQKKNVVIPGRLFGILNKFTSRLPLKVKLLLAKASLKENIN